VPAHDVIEEPAVHGEYALYGSPVTPLPVRLDESYDLVVSGAYASPHVSVMLP
jgi:hypothetical protein